MSTLMRDVNNGWFVVNTAGLDVGVVGAIHEYIGFEMQSRAKTCALTFGGLLIAL